MTKKKKGIFSKLKEKFSKSDVEFEDEYEFEDELEEEYEEEYLEQEVGDSTGEIKVSEELLAKSSEGTNHNITFDSLEKDEDEIEDLLNHRDDTEDVPSIQADSEQDDEEEEEFFPTEFKVSEQQKEELSELEAPVEQSLSEEELHDDQEYEEVEQEDEEYEEYEDELYEAHPPKQSVQQRFTNFLSNMKDKFPKKTQSNIAFDGGTIDDSEAGLKPKVNIDALKSFSWPLFVEKSFSPDTRQVIHRTFLTTLILSGTYYTGKLLASSVSAKFVPTEAKTSPRVAIAPVDSMRDQGKSIAQANLFNTIDPLKTVEPKKDEGPKIDEKLVCVKSNKKSKLRITLVNTIVLQDSVKSIAAVQLRGKNDILSIREGDRIQSDAQVGKIDRMKLVFKNLNTGECEYVETKGREPRNPKPINVVSKKRGAPLLNKYKDSRIKNVGNNFKIQKKVRDEMLSNISEVLTQARAIQIKNPDGSLSFKMTEVVPGSIYSKLNIQDGDIITGINGKKFNNLNEIMNLFGKIKEVDQLELSLKRDGVEQNLEYNFE
ncbi:PDZ domain-containing protein [Halobacteriovorax sp. HLS]|uniref:PDZ domain-containing protein n=1 Tax=Halobacteriovorax sp. HLS TaxID=2234000 RepID=UPI000FDB6610|nr:PDZ domain-containing protein [Halobacteriovorax sp. HLS]